MRCPTRIAIATIPAWMLCQASAWACPMCKLALETDDPQPRAYMTSILFMLGMVMAMFSTVGALTWWINRHETQSLEAAGYGHLFHNGVNAEPHPVIAAGE